VLKYVPVGISEGGAAKGLNEVWEGGWRVRWERRFVGGGVA